jgi:hypothetical protein
MASKRVEMISAAAMPNQGGFTVIAISAREQKDVKYPCDDDEY